MTSHGEPTRGYPVGDLQPGWVTTDGTVTEVEGRQPSKVHIIPDAEGHPTVHIVPDNERPPVYRVQFLERGHAHLGVPASRSYRVVQEASTVWVCVDCYFEHHGLLEEFDGDRDKLLSLLSDEDEVTAGLMYEAHECDAPDSEDECGCEEQTFSWSHCDGCGSHLGGSRHALTVWWPATAEVTV